MGAAKRTSSSFFLVRANGLYGAMGGCDGWFI